MGYFKKLNVQQSLSQKGVVKRLTSSQEFYMISPKFLFSEVERQPLLSMHDPINPDGLNPRLYVEGEYAVSGRVG